MARSSAVRMTRYPLDDRYGQKSTKRKSSGAQEADAASHADRLRKRFSFRFGRTTHWGRVKARQPLSVHLEPLAPTLGQSQRHLGQLREHKCFDGDHGNRSPRRVSVHAALEPQLVRNLIDTIIDRAHRLDINTRLTVVVGSQAAEALAVATQAQGMHPILATTYRGAMLSVVPTLHYWLVMVVPMISTLTHNTTDPLTFYGDLRTNTFTSALPPRN